MMNDDKSPWDAQKSASTRTVTTARILRIQADARGTMRSRGKPVSPRRFEAASRDLRHGCANPWRMSVDCGNRIRVLGEVGPDAGADGPRGARAATTKSTRRGERATLAGHTSWETSFAYSDVRLCDGGMIEPGSTRAPPSTNRHNTGEKLLPPAQPALIYYPGAALTRVSGTGERRANGRVPGPSITFQRCLASPVKFPAAYDRRC